MLICVSSVSQPTLVQASRSKLDRVTAAAHARNRASFHPQILEVRHPDPYGSRFKRRMSTGSAVDAGTGDVVESNKRQSRRAHTMQNTSETAIRMKDAEEKRVCSAFAVHPCDMTYVCLVRPA